MSLKRRIGQHATYALVFLLLATNGTFSCGKKVMTSRGWNAPKSVFHSILTVPRAGGGGLDYEKSNLRRFSTVRREADQSVVPLPPHSGSLKTWLTQLKVDADVGLSSIEVALRQDREGRNELPTPSPPSLWSRLLEQFEDRLVQLLLGVAALSALLTIQQRDWHAITEPLVILAILLANALIGVLQSSAAESSLAALQALQPRTAKVLRNGEWISDCMASDLVPGDILRLDAGDRVPADARIVRLLTSSLAVEESSLTGESTTVQKSAFAESGLPEETALASRENILYSGTLVASGSCLAVVTSIGLRTEIGKIQVGVEAAAEEEGKSPLAEQLDSISNTLGKAVLAIAISIWIFSIPKFTSPVFSSWSQGAIFYAKYAVALGVAAIPEGLPAVITLCLSLGTRRLAARNVIVRRLSSVETLGCTSVICTDKTGTLTTNSMTTTSAVTFAPPNRRANTGPSIMEVREYTVEGDSYSPVGLIRGVSTDELTSNGWKWMSAIATLCNEAKLEYREGRFGYMGEPTEAALKVLSEKIGTGNRRSKLSPEQLLKRTSNFWEAQFERLALLEFSRNRKSMSVLLRPKDSEKIAQFLQASIEPNSGGFDPKGNTLLVKGAAELILARSKYVTLDDGSVVPITPSRRKLLEQKLRNMATRPLRCIALAFKSGRELGNLYDVKSESDAAAALPSAEKFQDIESDLTLVGLTGTKDPARPDVAESIARCTTAGVRVMMITGDARDTAVAIAREVGILVPPPDITSQGEVVIEKWLNEHAFTSKEFFSLSDEEQTRLLKSGNKVFCRAEPADKQRLIKQLDGLGEVTAMTGDGVNDAPALKQAAIGVAMGITGTDVAKSAADMVLTDDRFTSIVAAVEEGRQLFKSIQAFIGFLLSSNLGEVFVLFSSTALGLPTMLSPLHLLWINLVTDGPPATALGFNPATPGVMREAPRRRDASFFTRDVIGRYLMTAIYVAVATIGSFVAWFRNHGVTFKELCNWTDCANWAERFAHSACAPNWPLKPCAIFSSSPVEGACSGSTPSKISVNGLGFLAIPQTMALTTLVLLELLKALCSVTPDQSLLSVAPWRNPWLLPAVLVPFALHLAAMYIPWAAKILHVAPLGWTEWRTVLKLALPIVLLDEATKFSMRVKAAKRRSTIEGRVPFNN